MAPSINVHPHTQAFTFQNLIQSVLSNHSLILNELRRCVVVTPGATCKPPSCVLICSWARQLTLTAPDELAVALHGWLCRRCVNVCINRCNSLWIKASAKCQCNCKNTQIQVFDMFDSNIIFLKTPEASFMLRGPWAQITHMVAPGLQQPPLLWIALLPVS